MDLEKLYDNIILRDLLQYLTPGSISLIGLCLLFEVVLQKLGINVSVFTTLNGSFLSLLLALVLAYAAGHLLTLAHKIFLRKQDKKRTAEMLNQKNWLTDQIHLLARNYYPELILVDEEGAHIPSNCEMLREMVRALIYQRRPLLNREYVVRHSILSRFCENMAGALMTSLVFVSLSAWVSWDKIITKAQPARALAFFSAILALILVILSIIGFLKRANKLRDMMVKHTFQIWYIDYEESHQVKDEQAQP